MSHLFDSDNDAEPRTQRPLSFGSNEKSLLKNTWKPPPNPWGEEAVGVTDTVVPSTAEVGHSVPKIISVAATPVLLQTSSNVLGHHDEAAQRTPHTDDQPFTTLYSSSAAAAVAATAPFFPPANTSLLASQNVPSNTGHTVAATQSHGEGHSQFFNSSVSALSNTPQPFSVTLPDELCTPALLPSPPQQREFLRAEPPGMNDDVVPKPKKVNSNMPVDEKDSWNEFINLKKTTEESVSRMISFYDQVVKLQLTHEQEATAYREAAEGNINQQRRSLDALTTELKSALTNKESLQALVAKKAEQVMECERSNYDLYMRLKDIEQRCVHVEDRAKVAEGGRKILEIRLKELEMSLEFTTTLVKDLRGQLTEAHQIKERALQTQYEAYEENRRNTISFYDGREKEMVREFNETVVKLQKVMELAMQEREVRLSEVWQETMRKCQRQHESLMEDIKLSKQQEKKEHEIKLSLMEREKERWYDQYRNEMTLLEQRHKEREEHLLADIGRRERELGEREQRMRVERAEEEQNAKVAIMAKEAELKAYYQKITEDIRLSFDKEREKLVNAFREQVQEISQQHLSNERELERMHREKEREMAQRYRIAGYEVDDRKGEVDLKGVSMQTQSALLSKFDAIEARQRKRAEETRVAFQTPSDTQFLERGK